MNITNTQEAIAENMVCSCVWHSTVESKYKKHLLGILLYLNEKVCNSMKDTNKILEKERSKNVVKALIIDAVESHLLLK